jgi:hypothetical protein
MTPAKTINKLTGSVLSRFEQKGVRNRNNMRILRDINVALTAIAPGTIVGALLMPFGQAFDTRQEHLLELFYLEAINTHYF